MWFNSMQREEPYSLDIHRTFQRWIGAFGNCETGAAWLSSARVVKCWVKSRNERNPYPLLPAVRPGTQRRLPVINWRKVGMTSSHHGPYDRPGATHVLQWHIQREATSREQADLIKYVVVRIESATRLHEVGIASNRRSECYGEYVPGPCTHRPSHHGSGLQKK